MTGGLGGTSLAIDNPNMPRRSRICRCRRWTRCANPALPTGSSTCARQSIDGSVLLEQDTIGEIERLEKGTMPVFYCHTGRRSAQAAEHFRRQGLSNVYNVAGGIEAWSPEVDASVPAH